MLKEEMRPKMSQDLQKVLVASFFLLVLCLPVHALPPEGWEPNDNPVRYTLPDGSGWVESDGLTFTTKSVTYGIKLVTVFSAPPAYMQPDESATFNMTLIYKGSSATLSGTFAQSGDATITYTSPNFAALVNTLYSQNPSLPTTVPSGQPESVWGCVAAVANGLGAGLTAAGACGSGAAWYYCAGAVSWYLSALHSISTQCVFVG